MLVSSNWEKMWLESQHCSKSIMNLLLPSKQTLNILEDLRTSCCSPNKAVQLEALKCWRIWINSQNPDDWKLNGVCFTAVRPLIIKKLQPLHKDVDICKMKLSLMWALLIKVQDFMQLEGPQYILEIFLQSCLTWLSSASGEECENEIPALIFQLLLAVFKKDEILRGCDTEMFPPFSTEFLHLKKIFHRFVDKCLNLFIYWRKVQDKTAVLKFWKYFLEHCELSCEHIPVPVWHKIFKLTGQICSEKNEPVKERLTFLHGCATVLKSVLSSSKFIDVGNLLSTPCEALLKKLIELCTVECKEFCDMEMFLYSKEICQVLSNKCVTIGGYDLCISVLDALEEFCLRSLFWGVWCGLVYCYKVQLSGVDKNHFTKIEMKFYRKLRGTAINFELDKSNLHKDCIAEVEKHIGVLNISCLCAYHSTTEVENFRPKYSDRNDVEILALEPLKIDTENQSSQYFHTSRFSLLTLDDISKNVVPVDMRLGSGNFSAFLSVSKVVPKRTVNLQLKLAKDIFKGIGMYCARPLFNGVFNFRFINLQFTQCNLRNPLFRPKSLSFRFKVELENKEMNCTSSCPRVKTPLSKSLCVPAKKNAVMVCERNRRSKVDEVVVSTLTTRSSRRQKRTSSTDEKDKLLESQKRKKRKSFETLVQEIVRKNKERKNEKNNRIPVPAKLKRTKKKDEEERKKESPVINNGNKRKFLKVLDRKLRNREKDVTKNKKKKEKKTAGKLENYFKITKKSGSEVKKEETRFQKQKKPKQKTRKNGCQKTQKEENEKKSQTNWRQPSLKTMINEKDKSDKTRQRLRTRSKVADAKVKEDFKKVTDNLPKLSPSRVFKVHDHEYAKVQTQDRATFERTWNSNKKRNPVQAQLPKVVVKPKKKAPAKSKKPKLLDHKKTEIQHVNSSKVKNSACRKLNNLDLQEDKNVEEKHDDSVPEFELEKPDFQELKEKLEVTFSETVLLNSLENKKLVSICDKGKDTSEEPDSGILEEEIFDSKSIINDVRVEETLKEFTPGKRRINEVKMLDSLRPSKKVKLAQENFEEDKFPSEVMEKENLEEKYSEFICLQKKEKLGVFTPPKSDESPKSSSGMISSRALRMIALLPESTKSSPTQWESSPRLEVFKSKKAPNVDRNSRASKMLALLSENVAVELEEAVDMKAEEVNSSRELTTTPTKRTSVSSLKSPKSFKKKRFIRFDDAKNETVLFQTDTPPSQILEEKKKCRKIRPAEAH